MKTNLLYYFIKEEMRLHVSLTNSKNYYSYPFTLICFFAGITLASHYFFSGLNTIKIGEYFISLLFVGGIMSGTFGLFARDFLERRFGDIGRLFQNSLLLPIKLGTIFLTAALSDTFFYIFWFILPVLLGYSIGLAVFALASFDLIYLAISSIFSFTTGLLLSFIFTVIFQRSKLVFTLLTLATVGFCTFLYSKFQTFLFFPFSIFYIEKSFSSFLMSLLLIILFILFAYLSIGREYTTTIRKKETRTSISFQKKLNPYILKDFIDMKRTGDLLAKPLFNVFIPSVLVLLLFLHSSLIDYLNFGILFFSIIIGTLGTQMLNSLISSDSMAYYNHLPISLKDFILPKMKLSLLICFLESLIILFFYSYYTKDFSQMLEAAIITLGLLIYNFALSFYLTGLHPNENIMHSKSFLLYFIYFVPILTLVTFLNALFPTNLYYLFGFLLTTALMGKLYLTLGIKKWSVRE